jgi:hypothetical protein
MLQDITLHKPTPGWLFKLIESVRVLHMKMKDKKAGNYFLIN